MDLLSKRERELTTIRVYSAYGFAALYTLSVIGHYGMRVGAIPYFKDVIMHTVLGVTGTYVAHQSTEKVAAELYYNQVLI